jgi:hypothetical protein
MMWTSLTLPKPHIWLEEGRQPIVLEGSKEGVVQGGSGSVLFPVPGNARKSNIANGQLRGSFLIKVF